MQFQGLNEHAHYKKGTGRPENGARKNSSNAIEPLSFYALIYTKTPVRYWCEYVQRAAAHPFSHIHSLLEKMASDGRRNRVRLSLGVEFDNQAAMSSFSRRLEYVRSLLTPPGLRTLDNQGLLSALFDHVEGSVPSSFPGVSRAPLSHLPGSSGSSTSLATTYRQDVSVVQSFNSNAGERNSHSYTPFIFQL